MTLVLTELSPYGIAMAADSAVTYTHKSGMSHAVPNAAQKLHIVPQLNAGLSCWGMGEIGGVATDAWIADFIAHNAKFSRLDEFASALAAQLNKEIPPCPSNESRLGFHVAGFEDVAGTPLPSFYHVHDGQSQVLTQRGTPVDPKYFNANHDTPPKVYQQLLASGGFPVTRNGDIQLYAELFELLERFFIAAFQRTGIVFPQTQTAAERADYLVFQIRTVAEIYRQSNLVPGIGGAISYLAITPNGISRCGVSY